MVNWGQPVTFGGPVLKSGVPGYGSLVYSVTIVNITKDARIVLLNEPAENIARHTQTLIYFIFLAAKIAIATA